MSTPLLFPHRTNSHDRPILVLLVCLAVILILATLLRAVGRNYIAALAGIAELRATAARILADTQNIDHSLRQQRRVLYDAHKRISAVPKGLEKPAA